MIDFNAILNGIYVRKKSVFNLYLADCGNFSIWMNFSGNLGKGQFFSPTNIFFSLALIVANDFHEKKLSNKQKQFYFINNNRIKLSLK